MTFKTTTLTAVMALGISAGAAMAQDTAAPSDTPRAQAGQSNDASATSASQQPVPVPGATGEPPQAGGMVPGTPAADNAVTGTADPAAGTLTNAPATGEAEVATQPSEAPAPADVPASATDAPAAPAADAATTDGAAPAVSPDAAGGAAPTDGNPAPAAETAPVAGEAAPAATAAADAATPAPAAETVPAGGEVAPAAADAPATAPAAPEAAPAGAYHQEITDVAFSFEGPFGKFDQFQLQRGLQVYTEVCAACHGMRYVPIRTLSDEGGPGLPEDQVRAYAATMDIEDADIGETRPRLPTDHFPHNTDAGAPDLSVMAKGRAGFHGPYGTGISQLVNGIGGPEYLYSVLTHYTGETKEEAGETYYENTAFPGGWIKMPPPLADDQVTYEDGHPATVANQAQDVSAFLMWAAEPKMMARKQVGLVSVIFLIGLTLLLYLTNTRLWRGVKHPTVPRQARRDTTVTQGASVNPRGTTDTRTP